MSSPPSPQRPEVAEGRLRYRVPPAEAGSRVDRLLGRVLAPDYSRSYLAALVAEGTLTVDGQRVRPAFRVEEGSLVEGPLGEPAGSLPGPEPMELTVLHEDEALIAVDKPVGLVIHPGSGARSGTLVNGLLARFPELSVVGRADRPGIVHRLDRETSGVLVVARSNDAARSLVNQFKAKTVKKRYVAVVWGEVPLDADWIDLPLGPHPRRPQLRAVVEEDGQPASTFYEVRRRLPPATVLDVSPHTGRTHQIRVHLEHLGFPVLGDPQYGGDVQERWRRWVAARKEAGLRAPVLARQALHAASITLRHPTDAAPPDRRARDHPRGAPARRHGRPAAGARGGGGRGLTAPVGRPRHRAGRPLDRAPGRDGTGRGPIGQDGAPVRPPGASR
jgi:23S rRNA pseudouridine1911/1915/1917 synthase